MLGASFTSIIKFIECVNVFNSYDTIYINNHFDNLSGTDNWTTGQGAVKLFWQLMVAHQFTKTFRFCFFPF